jgi:hypothetical protein
MTAVNRSSQQSSRKRNKAGWGARIETCLLQVQARRRERVSLDDFGAMIAAEMGRGQAFGKATISQWVSETNEPTIRAFEAIAALADCEPWWIVWRVGRGPANALEGELAPEQTAPARRGAK